MAELQATPCQAANTCQHGIKSARGDYLIQISWPLSWNSEREPKSKPKAGDVPVIYLTDGNAYFFTATEIVRRLEVTTGKTPIIVAVGYRNSRSVYPPRRVADMTPPSKKGYSPPTSEDGVVKGGSEEFLEIIESQVISLIEDDLFPHIPLKENRKALFGHSLGGLFSLYTMFTRTELFDTYIAASPSIWINGCTIVEEQEQLFLSKYPTKKRPNLFIMYGSEEQYMKQKPRQSDDDWKKAREEAREWMIEDKAEEIFKKMDGDERLGKVRLWRFEGEDHIGAAGCGLQRGIEWFLNEES